MDKFLIIDGNSLVNRAFYALPLLSNSSGEFSNAVYGFVNILTKAIIELKPKYIAVAFDHGKHTFRNEIYAQYKATRKGMPNELAVQMPILKKLLETMEISFFEKSEIEADDIIGTLAKTKGVEKVLLSGDRDLFQLLDEETIMWFPKKGVSEIDIISSNNLKEKFGVMPWQVVDFKALRGDASDNIPGVPGIGDKGALSLLDKFGSLDAIYENLESLPAKLKEKLENGKQLAFVSKQLATINTSVEIEFSLENLTYEFPYTNKTFEFFKQYEFKSLTRRTDIFNSATVSLAKQESMPFEKIKVESQQQLEKIISYIKSEGKFAFDFSTQFCVACSPNALYTFETEISFFSNKINVESALEALKDVFENPKIEKICLNSKKAKHILSNSKINLNGEIFDISIAQYLVGEKIQEQLAVPFFFFAKKELGQKMKDLGVLELFNKVEMPLASVLFEMEQNGLLADKNELEVLRKNLETELGEISKNVETLAGESFNINSPKQLGNILFNKLGLVAKNNKKNSTSVEILQQIENQHPIVSEILKYRKIQKLLSTYVEAFYNLVKDGDGFIHTVFNQTLTATGRLSSSEPNLQNLPIRDDEGKKLRKVFISRFENGRMISADYNQIELRLMAHCSQDETMIRSYLQNEDIHAKVASEIFDVALSSVTPAQRRLAKTVNFGIIYGISEYGLSQSLGTSVKQAAMYMQKFFMRFPRVKEYMNESIALAKEKGFSKTLFGRIRKIPELEAENSAVRKFGERAAINMPLQGTASDIIKIAMINVSNKLKENNMQAKLVLQIHDELILDCPFNEVEKAERILKTEMENVVSLSIPLPVEVESGITLYDC